MSQSLIVLWNVDSGKIQDYALQWVHNKTFVMLVIFKRCLLRRLDLCLSFVPSLLSLREETVPKSLCKLRYMHLRIKNAVFFCRCNMFKLYYHHSMLEENLQTYLTCAISLNLLRHSLMLGKTHQLTRYFLGW
jgi:hypothetical protein